MQYLVRAHPRMDSLSKFWNILNDGTVANQEPDGQEIIASMKRAVINEGKAEWSETCFCNPPLRHERTTIYDQYFTDMKIEPFSEQVKFEGQRFWEYLRSQSNKVSEREPATAAAVRIKYAPIRII